MSLFSVIGTIGTIYNIASSASSQSNGDSSPAEMMENIKSALVNKGNQIKENYDLVQFDGNICKFVNSLLVEPVIITTAEARRSPSYQDVLEAKVSVFVAYYLQAFKILTDLYGKDAKFAIEVLRSKTNYNTYKLSRESFLEDLFDMSKECLISGEVNDPYNMRQTEDNNNYNKAQGAKAKSEGRNYDPRNDDLNKIDKGKLTFDKGYEIFNKIGARDLKLEFSLNGAKVVLPIIVKPRVIESTIENIIALISPEDYNKTLAHRWREWRSGGITFSEFIFATDIVKEYKRNKLKDKDDLINITTNANINAVATLASKGALGFSKHYNMFLIGSGEVKHINSVVKGDIYKPAFRDRFLEIGSGIVNTILNDDYERATMQISGIYADTVVPYKRLQNPKNKDDSMAQLITSLMMNKTPQF